MVSKCEKFLYDLEHGKVTIVPSETTLKNGFDITLVNEDYTLGKVIEFYLYQQNFIADKTLSFCGFRKPHPHATDSIIRVAFHSEIDPVGVSGYVQGATQNAITAFKKLVEQMGGDLKKTERVRLSTGMSMSSVSNRGASPKKVSGAAASASASAADAPQSEQGAAASQKQKKPKSSSIKLDLSKITVPSALSSSKKESKVDESEE